MTRLRWCPLCEDWYQPPMLSWFECAVCGMSCLGLSVMLLDASATDLDRRTLHVGINGCHTPEAEAAWLAGRDMVTLYDPREFVAIADIVG